MWKLDVGCWLAVWLADWLATIWLWLLYFGHCRNIQRSSPRTLGLGASEKNQSQVHRGPSPPRHRACPLISIHFHSFPIRWQLFGSRISPSSYLFQVSQSGSQSLFALVWFWLWFWFCSIYIYANARLGRYIQFFTWISRCIYCKAHIRERCVCGLSVCGAAVHGQFLCIFSVKLMRCRSSRCRSSETKSKSNSKSTSNPT